MSVRVSEKFVGTLARQGIWKLAVRMVGVAHLWFAPFVWAGWVELYPLTQAGGMAVVGLVLLVLPGIPEVYEIHPRQRRGPNVGIKRIKIEDVFDALDRGTKEGALIGYELVFRSTKDRSLTTTFSDGTSKDFRDAVRDLHVMR